MAKTQYVAVATDGTEIETFKTRQKAVNEYDRNKEVEAVYTLPGQVLVVGDAVDLDEAITAANPPRRRPVGTREKILPDDVVVTEKFCSKCKTEKPAEDFGFQALSADGLRHWCKACVNVYTVAWRKAKKEKEKEPAA